MSKIVLSSLKHDAKFLNTNSEGFWLCVCVFFFSELGKKKSLLETQSCWIHFKTLI